MMAGETRKDSSRSPEPSLQGTTLRVYRYMLKQHNPLGISDIQRGLSLSSPSVAQYHIQKLIQLGLAKEEQSGYVVDRVVIENIIRIRRTSIPIQSAYVAFFVATLAILLALLRPTTVTSLYFFAVIINIAALAISAYEAAKTWGRL